MPHLLRLQQWTTLETGFLEQQTTIGSSMAIPSDGSYGISEGIIYSFPVDMYVNGNYEIVQALEINEFSETCLQGK